MQYPIAESKQFLYRLLVSNNDISSQLLQLQSINQDSPKVVLLIQLACHGKCSKHNEKEIRQHPIANIVINNTLHAQLAKLQKFDMIILNVKWLYWKSATIEFQSGKAPKLQHSLQQTILTSSNKIGYALAQRSVTFPTATVFPIKRKQICNFNAYRDMNNQLQNNISITFCTKSEPSKLWKLWELLNAYQVIHLI